MDSRANAQLSTSCRPIRPAACYRVMARYRNHEPSLVSLAENLRQAVNRAKEFCDTPTTSHDGIVSVRVEEWVGTLTEGEWRPVSPWAGGFSHRFASRLRARNLWNDEQRNPSLPRTGDRVECILLSEKTRKGGWKAKLLPHGPEGPITNTADVAEPVQPGQTVALRVGAISDDGKRVQFHWQQADNAACRVG